MNNGVLNPTEPHPASLLALEYIKSLPYNKLVTYQSAFASCSLSGNRMAEICSETLRRLLHKETVSDRYLLGLAWYIRDMEDNEHGKEMISGVKKKGK